MPRLPKDLCGGNTASVSRQSRDPILSTPYNQTAITQRHSSVAKPNRPRPVLLLTRPEQDAQRFAQMVTRELDVDWRVVVSPLIAPAPVKIEACACGAGDVIFTSQHAVAPFSAACGAARVAWCVGSHTAAVARAAGFDVKQGPGDAKGLLSLIAQLRPTGPLIHARGEHIAHPIVPALQAAGFQAQDVLCYRQRAMDLSAHAQAVLAQQAPVIAPVFSPRTASILCESVLACTAPLYLVAISTTVAENLRAFSGAYVQVAETPTAAGILQVLAGLAHRVDAT